MNIEVNKERKASKLKVLFSWSCEQLTEVMSWAEKPVTDELPKDNELGGIITENKLYYYQGPRMRRVPLMDLPINFFDDLCSLIECYCETEPVLVYNGYGGQYRQEPPIAKYADRNLDLLPLLYGKEGVLI